MEAGTNQMIIGKTVQAEEPKKFLDKTDVTETEQKNFALEDTKKNKEKNWREENWCQDPEDVDVLIDPDDETCTDVPSFGAWLATIFLLLVPAINLMVLFEWATGNTKYSIRVNFAKAMILAVITVYLVLAIGIVFI